MQNMKNTLQKVGSSLAGKFALTATALLAAAGTASAQTGSGNTGADAIIESVEGLVPVAAAVVAAAVLVVVVPWGAKMAVRAFKSISG
jgi:hypothetical protein